jgi:23S rRNA (guanosine2251-2'-O)-methyltransferase
MTRLITGLQPVREAIRVHGERLERVLVEERGGPQIEAVARFATDRGASVVRVQRGELDRASKGARHQGAIAYAPDLVVIGIDELAKDLPKDAVIIALDEIEDPQNFGAVIRSAVALGATSVLWPEHHAAPLSPATFRASAGAVEHARLCRVSALPSALDRLQAAGATIVGLDANGEKDIRDVEADGPVVLVIGAEGKGLRKPVKRACTELARLPMTGVLDSLNASVAGGIAVYEMIRRRPRTQAD